jgi:hypothetical protein
MNDFFDLDAPLFRFLTRVADMVILSLLWLIGSLPLFTLGISSTALYYAVNKSLIEDRGPGLPPELPTGNFELSCSGSAGEHSAG